MKQYLHSIHEITVLMAVMFTFCTQLTGPEQAGTVTETENTAGTLLNEDGTPSIGAKLFLMSSDFLPGRSGSVDGYIDSTISGPDGSFTFAPVDTGSYVITASDTAGKAARVTGIHVQSDSVELPEITLKSTGGIAGALHLIDPTDMVTIKVYGFQRTFVPGSDGSFLLENLPASKYEIRFETPNMTIEFLDSLAVPVVSGALTPMDTVTIPALRSYIPKEGVVGLCVESGLLYMRSTGSLSNLSIYDISTLSSPVLLGRYAPVEGIGTIVVKNGFAFLSDFGTLDIRDPSNIVMVDQTQSGRHYEYLEGNTLYGFTGLVFRIRTVDYLWDSSAVAAKGNFAPFINNGSDVAARDGYAYLMAMSGISVIDARDLANPLLADSVPLVGSGTFADPFTANAINHNESQVEIIGDYLYVCLVRGTQQNEMLVFDLSTDPVRPDKISTVPLYSASYAVGGSVLSHFALTDAFAFFGETDFPLGSSGVVSGPKIHVMDIRDPYAIKVGPVYQFTSGSNGASGYVLATSDNVLVVSDQEGVRILQVSE